MFIKQMGLCLQAAVLTIGLASCGFTPVYAPDSETAAALSDISLAAPKNEHSYLFVREMEERLGRASGGSKLLNYKITIKGEGVESDSDRRRFVGVVLYDLVDQDTSKTVLTGSADSFTGYSVSNGLFVSARQDALERLIVILSDQVTRDLMIKLSTLK